MQCKYCSAITTISRKNKRSSEMMCDACEMPIDDLIANEVMGVEFAELYSSAGVSLIDTGYVTRGNKYEKFPSWFCLKFFDTYDQRVEHDRKYHVKGVDPQLGMVPSGFDPMFKVECGD